MKKLSIILAALPAVLLLAAPALGAAQGAATSGGKGQGPGGPPADPEARFARMEKRMRVARAIGLAEALDLDEKQAEKMREVLGHFDDERQPLMKQMHDGMQVLRQAAHGDKANLAKVDEGVQKVFDARSRITTLDKEMFQALSKDLTPEKRARAAVFLAHFQGRFGAGMGPNGHGHMGPGHGGPGMGHGPGMGGGMGPGGMGPPPGGGDDFAPDGESEMGW